MLRAKKGIMVAGLIAIFAVGAALAVDKRPDSPGPGSSSKELVAAARRAYELRLPYFLNGEDRGVEETCLWSKRWMTAEWDLRLEGEGAGTGVKDHFQRMVELEKIAKRMSETGQMPDYVAAVAAYYRIEAELMLARAGG